MLRAIAEAARVFESAEYHALAMRSAEYLWSALVRDDGGGGGGGMRVFRVHSRGVAKIPGFLDDYAALALAFIAVYQLTFDRRWLDRARSLGEAVNELFWDDDAKQFFDTASDAERLITRPREITDNAVPSGNSLAAELMLLLAEYFGERPFRARADAVIASVADPVARYPTAFGHLLGVMDMTLKGCLEIALAGDPVSEEFRALSTAIARIYLPGLVLAGGAPDSAAVHQIPLLEGRGLVDGKVAAYVCRNYSCDRPVTDPAGLASLLGGN